MLLAGIVTYVAQYRTRQDDIFYDIVIKDMDHAYHNLLFRERKIQDLRREWNIQDIKDCIGKLVLLDNHSWNKPARAIKLSGSGLGMTNDNDKYRLTNGKLLWELGDNGT